MLRLHVFWKDRIPIQTDVNVASLAPQLEVERYKKRVFFDYHVSPYTSPLLAIPTILLRVQGTPPYGAN
jgi:hypothetical protein